MSGEVTEVDGFADPRVARLYDAECPWSAQDDFYLALDLAAGSVLDVGCGTGTRLARARQVGHGGRLVGLDPAEAARTYRPADELALWLVYEPDSPGRSPNR